MQYFKICYYDACRHVFEHYRSEEYGDIQGRLSVDNDGLRR